MMMIAKPGKLTVKTVSVMEIALFAGCSIVKIPLFQVVALKCKKIVVSVYQGKKVYNSTMYMSHR